VHYCEADAERQQHGNHLGHRQRTDVNIAAVARLDYLDGERRQDHREHGARVLVRAARESRQERNGDPGTLGLVRIPRWYQTEFEVKAQQNAIRDVTLRVVARRLAIAAIIAITIGGPIVEMFDRWDQTLQDGNDTEANVVVVALCVGVTFAIGPIVVVNRIRGLSSTSVMRVVVSHVAPREIASFLGPLPTSSPPTILRV
jgi:hypothetical protein